VAAIRGAASFFLHLGHLDCNLASSTTEYGFASHTHTRQQESGRRSSRHWRCTNPKKFANYRLDVPDRSGQLHCGFLGSTSDTEPRVKQEIYTSFPARSRSHPCYPCRNRLASARRKLKGQFFFIRRTNARLRHQEPQRHRDTAADTRELKITPSSLRQFTL